MNCLRSCCQSSCLIRQPKSKHFPQKYDSLEVCTQYVNAPDTEIVSSVPYYQQAARDSPTQQFHLEPTQATGVTPKNQLTAERRPCPDHRSHESHPSLSVSLHHHVQRRVLGVQLHTISELPIKDGQGLYIIATLLPSKEQIKSKIILGSLNFVVDQTLEFSLGCVHHQSLKLSVYSATHKDLLGTASISLEKLGKGRAPIVHKLDIALSDKVEVSATMRF